jgi:thymidine kinase
MRLVNAKPVFFGMQIAIDGDNVTYESVCAWCYAKHKRESSR